jgi:mannose-6-phosphate isomerase
MENSEKIFRIKGSIKHYDWGGKTFLPQLLNISNEENKPCAEYWLGDKVDLSFGKLPYLFKVQDVEKMLSIQVHPTKEVAEKKFREENEKGIPADAPHRNYKDENHKPELLSPLGDFYLLHGFRPAEEIQKMLKDIAEFNFLKEEFNLNDYKKLYTRVMTMDQEEVNKKLEPLLTRVVPLYNAGKLSKDQPDFWAARASQTFRFNGNTDRGIFSIYFFNLVVMKKGEALFQDAGLPHAYLEGHTMEIMANSDNVLRGGLTPKHIDVKELLEHIRFVATIPNVIPSTLDDHTTGEQVYKTPAADFQLSRIIITKGQGLSVPAIKTDIYFIYKGNLTAIADEQQEQIARGNSILAVPGTVVHFAAESDAVIYRATEPIV